MIELSVKTILSPMQSSRSSTSPSKVEQRIRTLAEWFDENQCIGSENSKEIF